MKQRKMMKKAIALTCAVAAFGTTLAGCNAKKAADTEQTLEIFLWDAGYGTQFCKDLIESFKNQSWVKESYPNLQILFESDGNTSTYTTKIDAGEKANTVDLFLTANLANYTGKDNSGYERFSDLTEKVFNQKVPGEDVTVYEKMLPTYLDSIRYYERGQDSNTPNVAFKSYVYPWASGMDGILYNADHLKTLEMEMPLTTNQFIEACETISNSKALPYNLKEDGDYAILTDGSGNYWHELYPTWWGQYEGIDEYYNFFNGVSGNRGNSPEVFRQKGKLYSLQVLEKVLDWDNGYVYQKRTGLDFMQAQTNFIKGEGVFYSNGDWFAKEMEQTAKDLKQLQGIEYDIRMMPTPIVSEIIQKTPSIPDEQTLRAVIRAIDLKCEDIKQAKEAQFEGYELVTNVTEEDYQTILEARGVIHAIGPRHQAAVPSYAKGKEIAFDFLKFMATDEAQEIYLKATGGASLPFEYDVKKKNPSLYEQLLPIEKNRLDMAYDSVYEVQVLPLPESFPLVKWGEMSPVYSLTGLSVMAFFAAKGSTGTAKQVYDNDIAYYIDGGNFEQCLINAGLK